MERMNAEKPENMRVAKRFDKDYWDGDRKYGYGGMKHDGRWKPVTKAMGEYYDLKADNKILDIGCGKGFLLKEFRHNLNAETWGTDISLYAKDNNPMILNHDIGKHSLSIYGFTDKFFDFTYSINVFHNLCYQALKAAIREMVRFSKDKMYICVEGYETEEQLCNLQCWALTALSFYTKDDWMNILSDNGYNGDLEVIYFD